MNAGSHDKPSQPGARTRLCVMLGLALLEQATAICRECAWVHQHHGEVLSRANRLFEAQRALERAIEIDPDFGLAHMNLGIVLAQRGRATDGVEHMRRAVSLQPSNADWRIGLAKGLVLVDRRSEALGQIEEAMRQRPDRRSEWQPLIEILQSGRGLGL